MREWQRVLRWVVLLGAATDVGCSGAAPEGTESTSSAITAEDGVDYSFARPSAGYLASLGYKFAVRYVSPEAVKNLSAAEAKSLIAAGLDIVVVWEEYATNALGGFHQGVADARTAVAQATACGEPADRPIYFAVDFDAASGDAATIDAYFDGVASVIGRARTGVYGGIYIVGQLFNAGKVTWGWQTYAWSGGAWDHRAQLRQVENNILGNTCDLDQSAAVDFGQWGRSHEYGAKLVSQSFPSGTALTMVEGQTIPAYIEVRNVGIKSWGRSTQLATTEPRNRSSVFADSTWIGPDRPSSVTSGTVPPGGTYKFTFDLHAPGTPGTYVEHFGLVEEGVAWFGDPGQGGPPDNDLQVTVVVEPQEAGTVADAGAHDAGASEAGATERDAAEADASEAGSPPREDDAGMTGHPDARDSGSPADDAAADGPEISAAWHGHDGHGCSVASTPTGGSEGSLLLVGLVATGALAWRRRGGRQRSELRSVAN
jgi:MYXO-CTERM domain-containing protein